MRKYTGLVALVGRILLSLIFLLSGVSKIMDWHGTMQFMASKGMPLVPFFLAGAVFIEIFGSLAVLLGYKARLGAFLLAIFIIPAAVIFHDFWNVQGAQHLTEKLMFMKDMAILGGLLQVLAFGPGSLSLDRQ